MQIELKELSKNDGLDIFEMIKEIGPGENGFSNSGYEMKIEEFPEYLDKQIGYSKGIGLEPQWIPQTVFWLFIDSKPIGIGKLRHYLNDDLRKYGGHIGYCIRPSERGKGYGNIILREVLKKAKEIGIEEVLITCNEDNIPSRKVIEENGGVLKEFNGVKCKYWIKL